MKRLFPIICLLAFFNIGSVSQITCDFNSNCKKAMKLLYQFKQNQATTVIEQEEKTNPDNLASTYLRHYNLFLSFIASQDNNSYIKLNSGIEKTLSLLKRYNSPWSLALQANILLHKGIADFTMNKHWAGGIAFMKSHQLQKALYETNPDFPEALKLNALFNILWAQIPDDISYFTQIMGLGGNMQKGMEQLAEYAQIVNKQDGLNEEALLFKGFTALKFNRSKTILPDNILKEHISPSPILRYFYGEQTLKNKNQLILSKLLDSIPRIQTEQFPLLLHLDGKHLLNHLSPESTKAFCNFLNSFKGYSFKADALMRLSWCYQLGDKPELAAHLADSILKLQYYPTANDQQALSESDYFKKVPIEFIKARLLFDQGNYLMAKNALLLINDSALTVLNNPQKIEWHYRMGRIEQSLNQKTKALHHYQFVIEHTPEDTRYFGPYAALFATEIALEANHRQIAIKHLKQAEKLNNGEYSSDIKRKIRLLEKRMETIKKEISSPF
ncbi:hypothetical protein DMA11_20310 [Marinilabiliaceae bacterium JC017]|nr:hypothetical protein DMA11_20310 [Marinilabiliaceae bacterium JC017]